MIYIVAFSSRGCSTALRIAEGLGLEYRVFSKTTGNTADTETIITSISDWTSAAFKKSEGIVFVGATGIAVRAIAPHLKNKMEDPAIVCVDELGRYSISLLSGHIGGANILAERIALTIGAEPIITTATDINKKFSVDSFATSCDMHIGSMALAKDVSAAVLEGKFVGLKSDYPMKGCVPNELTIADTGELGIYITSKSKEPFEKTLSLFPRNHVLGIGCKKGTPKADIDELVTSVLNSFDISIKSIRLIASIDLKKEEEGLLKFASDNEIPVIFFSSGELNSLPDIGYSRSDFVIKITGVDCVSERSAIKASINGELIVKKISENGVTVAIVREPFELYFGDE